MTGLETVKICTGYKLRGEIIEHYPASLKLISECEAVYEEHARLERRYYRREDTWKICRRTRDIMWSAYPS